MKKLLYFAAACLLLASCSEAGYVGDVLLDTEGSGEITFSQFVPNTTRAATGGKDGAAMLNNNFIVYGYKIASGDASGDAEKADGSIDKKVFDLYNVNYVDGSANSTLSNTSGWEYVGLTSKQGAQQTVKYWDYSAKEYIFSAISCGSGNAITVTKITSGDAIYDKGWKLTVPSGTTLDNLYASDRKLMSKPTPAGTKYGEVKLTFYSLATRIRFAIYETVPGYSVKIDKFYYNSTSSTTNFGVDGTFKGMNASGDATTLTVVYASSDCHPILKYSSESTSTYMQFGTNLLGNAIGTASNSATYDKDNESYTLILPYESKKETSAVDNVLQLKLDYTLTSTDGSGETIKVYGATANVPTAYTQWKNSYAYTYLFKISDNTGGSTGGGSSDPKGLYPITFDACVTTTDTDNNQETITTVTDPSITTYQAGKVVSGNNEYQAGDITVSVLEGTSEANLTSSNFKLFTAFSTDGKDLTEKYIENYKNNGVILTDVSTSITNYTSLNAKAVTFKALAGKTYVVEYTKSGVNYYKAIKVTGTPSTSYTLETYKAATCASGDAISAVNEGDNFYVKVYEQYASGDAKKYPVTGAAKNFDADTYAYFDVVEESTTTPGTYKFTAKAGVTTTAAHAIKITTLGTVNITINAYEFASGDASVIAGETQTITLNYKGTAATDVDDGTNFDVTTGLTIESVADGVVTLKAAKNAQNGTIKYKNNNTVVATANVIVKHYSIIATKNVINLGGIPADKITKLTVKLANAGAYKLTNTTTGVATLAGENASGDAITASGDGTIDLTGKAVGTAVIKAPDDTEISIEVTNFNVSFYNNASCSDPAITTTLAASTTYYVKFKDNTTEKYAQIVASKGTLTKTSNTGVYEWTTPAASVESTTTIKYTYEGVVFTLYSQTF